MADKKEYLTGKTPSGFSFRIDRDVLDDWELFEDIDKVDGGDLSALMRVLNALLGEKQKSALKEHCRKDGRVSAKAMMVELKEIFVAAGEQTKNS